jgi:hypothetical protein
MTVLRKTKLLSNRALLVAGLAAAFTGAAFAQQRAADLLPQAGEQRLTLNLGARSVAFAAKIAPIARETIPFEPAGHAVTEDGRQAMARLQESLFRQPGGSLILVVYGENETLAYQRARAVRGELAERHSMDQARIIATGRKADGHAGDLAVVDVYAADATRCGGCGGSTFRTIALDSGTSALVTSTAEALPAARSTAEAPAEPRTTAPAPAPAAPRIQRIQPAAPAAAPTPAPRHHASVQAGGCARPKIIIDDYYPGGPIVPCRSGR